MCTKQIIGGEEKLLSRANDAKMSAKERRRKKSFCVCWQEKLPQYLLLILRHHTTLNIVIIFVTVLADSSNYLCVCNLKAERFLCQKDSLKSFRAYHLCHKLLSRVSQNSVSMLHDSIRSIFPYK